MKLPSPDFTAPPGYEERVRSSFALQGAMTSFGIEIVDLGPGWIDLSVRHSPAFTQQDGFVHAGVIATAMDSACGYAAYSLAHPGVRVLTSEYKINLLRPASGSEFLARGMVIKPGRTLTVSQSVLTRPGEDKPLAIMTGTIALLAP